MSDLFWLWPLGALLTTSRMYRLARGNPDMRGPLSAFGMFAVNFLPWLVVLLILEQGARDRRRHA